MKGGANTCNPSYPTTGSLDQGANFAKLTASYHGGRRRNMRSKSRMVRRSVRRSNHRGGSFVTPYSDYPSATEQLLPSDLRALAHVSNLDAKFVELPDIQRAAGVPMAGGSRSRRNRRNRRNSRKTQRRGHRGGNAPINAPSMILSTPQEEAAARLNPQWYTENTVIPNFRGPVSVPGGSRKSRKARRT
jgi:hypothetical protein